MPRVTCALELDRERSITQGSEGTLRDALRRGADLLVSTIFRHGEHIDPSSGSEELIEETAEFRVTYLVDDRWVAGIMSLRQPISLPDGFGPRPSMSLFLYNEDGQQAIARPFLDGQSAGGVPGPAPLDHESELYGHAGMPKYHRLDNWDVGTNALCENFIYDFDVFRYWVRDDWREVLSTSTGGAVLSGSVEDLARAAATGSQVKVAVRGLCDDLRREGYPRLEHEVLVQAGAYYYYTQRRLFIAGTHPVVRVRASIPLRYESRNWDFGWLMCRSDGLVVRRLCDPYTLKFTDSEARHAVRWFVR